MHFSMKSVLFSIMAVTMAAGAQANTFHHGETTSADVSPSPQQVINASGLVKDIDLDNKKITIDHEAIPSVGWPAMTMRFTFTHQDISSLKAGSKATFSFVQQGNISLLQEIKTSQP